MKVGESKTIEAKTPVAAVLATMGDMGSRGYEQAMAKEEGKKIQVWVEECYCTWINEYEVSSTDKQGTFTVKLAAKGDENAMKQKAGSGFRVVWPPPRQMRR